MKDEEDALYEFGPFRVDPRERLLVRGEDVVPLAPKLFDALLVLVAHDGELVTREVLSRALWPDTFVDEGAPAKTLWLLRKALATAGGASDAIQTVPRVGYRFRGAVRRVARKERTRPTPHAMRAFE